MQQFFSDTETARRYDLYRPKVHAHIIELIKPLIGNMPKISALDVACGSGDSTEVLYKISNRVVAVDRSAAMLKLAAKKCDRVENYSAEQLPSLDEKFDLVSTCMAFHWFDQSLAVAAYKSITHPGGHWLIYNFSFDGGVHSNEFKKSFETYLKLFPTPPRHEKTAAYTLRGDAELKLIFEHQNKLKVSFDLATLIGYLGTQSNVQARVQAGESYKCIEQQLHELFFRTDFGQPFDYRYTVELYQFNATTQYF